MLKHKELIKIIIAVLLLGSLSFAAEQEDKKRSLAPQPKRLSMKIVDLGKVHTIYMVAGMATLIEIPGPVTGIRIGNPEEIKYFQPEKPENEVTLILQSSFARPTNLIIRSGKKKYVFDIVPSKTIHQDTVEIKGSFGSAEFEDSPAILIDSSEKGKK